MSSEEKQISSDEKSESSESGTGSPDEPLSMHLEQDKNISSDDKNESSESNKDYLEEGTSSSLTQEKDESSKSGASSAVLPSGSRKFLGKDVQNPESIEENKEFPSEENDNISQCGSGLIQDEVEFSGKEKRDSEGPHAHSSTEHSESATNSEQEKQAVKNLGSGNISKDKVDPFQETFPLKDLTSSDTREGSKINQRSLDDSQSLSAPAVPPAVLPEVPPAVLPEVPPAVLPEVPPAVLPEVPPAVLPEVPPAVLPEVPPAVLPEVPPAGAAACCNAYPLEDPPAGAAACCNAYPLEDPPAGAAACCNALEDPPSYATNASPCSLPPSFSSSDYADSDSNKVDVAQLPPHYPGQPRKADVRAIRERNQEPIAPVPAGQPIDNNEVGDLMRDIDAGDFGARNQEPIAPVLEGQPIDNHEVGDLIRDIDARNFRAPNQEASDPVPVGCFNNLGLGGTSVLLVVAAALVVAGFISFITVVIVNGLQSNTTSVMDANATSSMNDSLYEDRGRFGSMS